MEREFLQDYFGWVRDDNVFVIEKTGTKVFLIAFKSFFLFNDSSLKSAILPEEHLRVVNVADAVMRLFVVVVVVVIPN